jgi:predicted enzyme related to lactoylglutathione lyase
MPIKPTFAFVLEPVTDIEAAKRFYVEVFGMQVEREAPVFVQLKDGNGARYAIASDSTMSGGRAPELYWLVEDAEAAFAELSQTAEICMPLKEEAFGKVFGVRDPAGQPQYLLEFAASRPSREID